MNKQNFESRLRHFSLSAKAEEKYLNLFDFLVAANQIPQTEIAERCKKIGFACHAAITPKGAKLRLEESEMRGSVLCLAPDVSAKDNLLKVDVNKAQPTKKLHRFEEIYVYRPADSNWNPYLTKEDVVAQIPDDMLPKVKAFALQLHDNFFVSGYNLLLNSYEYRVELYE